VIYVAPSGNDSTGNGRSAGSAYRTLTAAVAALPSGLSTPAVIKLAPGAYTEPGTIDLGQRKNLTIEGSGIGVTNLTFSGTGSSIVSHWTVNSSSGPCHIVIRNLSIANANASNVGAAIEQRSGNIVQCLGLGISGHKYGVIFDQTEIAHIDLCDIQGQITAGIWLTRGPDWTPSAATSPPYTNNITIARNQINEPSTCVGVIDDGGWSHAIENNSFNGCSNQIVSAGVSGGVIRGNEMEAAANHNIIVGTTTFKLGTSVGPSTGLLISHNTIDTTTTGNAAINFTGSAYVTLVANSLSSTGYAVRGVSNVVTMVSLGNMNLGTGGALHDSKAANHVALDQAELALLGPAFKTALKYNPPPSGTTMFLDLGNGTKDSGGTVAAYGIGRGDLSLVNTNDYRVGTTARHRFLVDGTEVFMVDAHGPRAVGQAVGLASLNTAQRNALGAANVGAGGAVWDNSLGKPVFSDGTNWRDSAANIV
jgi:hypothetical protein